MATDRAGAARLRWEARTLAGRSPLLSSLLVRNSGYPVRDDTDIVIEGFPRTGNTFAVVAFLMAQEPDEVRVAHHTHVPATLLAAVRRGLPAVALVREPREACLSFAVRLPSLTLGQALRSYAAFYSPLLPHRGRLVVAPFEQVTADLGPIIRTVNARFGTSFVELEHTQANVRRALARIEAADRRSFGDGDLYRRMVAAPDAARRRLKEARAAEYEAPRLARLRRRAEAVHRAFTLGADALRVGS